MQWALGGTFHLVIKESTKGIICPDDGAYTAYDICRLLAPNKKKSRFFGWALELIGNKSSAMKNYYGAIFYDKSLTDVFEGRYRKYSLEEALKIINEEE